MSPKMQKIFDSVAAMSLDKQDRLLEELGDDFDWNFDTGQGRLDFSWPKRKGKRKKADRSFLSVQILGTESELTHTWLWGWANTVSEIPEARLQIAARLKDWGKKEGVSEFTERKLPLGEKLSAHALAIVASGLTNASFYYRAPFENGAAFLLVKDPAIPPPEADPIARVVMFFPRVLANPSLPPVRDHRMALIDYLSYYGLEIQENTQLGPEGTALAARHPSGGKVLIATFDKQGRMEEMTMNEPGEQE